MDKDENKHRGQSYQQERFFWANASGGSGWYYEAREGVRGPFKSKVHASTDLARLIQDHPKKR